MKPPRLAGGEAETLRALLQYQRESLARAELTWVACRFAGLDVVIPEDQPEPGDTVETVTAAYRQAWRQTDAAAFSGASLEELCRRPEADPPVSLRWVLMHLLEETARHAGHADILRELIDGRTGR
jgi:hypothetical protein